MGAPPIASGRLPVAAGEAVADTRLGLQVGQTVDIGGHVLRVVGTADGVTYYFCRAGCRRAFEADPAAYVEKGTRC